MPPGAKHFSIDECARRDRRPVARFFSLSLSWKVGQRCLVPMQAFSSRTESGAVRWKILAGRVALAVAGLYRSWREADGSTRVLVHALTINADAP
jgi:putative SOS response-associated peptidase YedK